MRTQQEILDRINELRPNDFFGFQTGWLISYLDYEHAKTFLKDGVTSDDWKPAATDREAIISQMREYMGFAWEKANSCRGISAGRSMDHYSTWLWMIKVDLGDMSQYEFYGKDNLVKICNHFGWDASQWDDGIRVNSEDELEDE